MSFPENDRIFQSDSGKTFPNKGEQLEHAQDFIPVVAQALKLDFGGGPAAVKRIAKLVHANERAVRNWFEGKNGPSGEHLIVLMFHSDAVFRAVLELAGRSHLVAAVRILRAKEQLREALAAIDALDQE